MKKLIEDEDLTRRAMAAYWNRCVREGSTPSQPNGGSDLLLDEDGKQYVVLSNVRGAMAVYRVRNDGALKWLKRYPKEIDEIF